MGARDTAGGVIVCLPPLGFAPRARGAGLEHTGRVGLRGVLRLRDTNPPHGTLEARITGHERQGEPPVDEWQERLQRVRRGEAAARDQLFMALLPRVRNLVRYLVRGDREVDDISQQALLQIWSGLASYRGDGSFTAWTDRITARCVFGARRRETRDEIPVGDATEALRDPAGCGHASYQRRRELAAALDTLPSAQRDALVLHRVVGCSVAETALELQCPEETVRSRIRLGLQRLRAQLGDESEERPSVHQGVAREGAVG